MIENLLPEYLFKKKSSASNHIPQGAPFSSSEAIKNGQGFQPLFSPSEQLQKKQIYLNYQSIFRLWDKNERALIIAKLKEEGFDIFFIFEKNKRSVRVEINQDLEVEINNTKKSIFLLDDRDLEKLSQIDQERVINKLGLAIDDSIILEYHQFKEIADILGVNSWVQNGAFKSHLRFSDIHVLNGSKFEYAESIKGYLHQEKFDEDNLKQMMINYFQLPGFDAEDKKIKKLLEKFLEYFKKDTNVNKETTAKILVNAIQPIYQDNPENVKKIFDHLLNYPFPSDKGDDKIIFQKFIILNFWFYHPDLSELIAKAQTISGYEGFNQNQIAEDLLEYKINQITKFDKHIDLERLGVDTPLGEKIIENYIAYYSEIQQQAISGEIDICDYLMILMKYGVKLEFSINDERDEIILSINGEKKSFHSTLLTKLLNNKELNDKFSINDLLIKYFEIFINYDINHNFGNYHCGDLIKVIRDNFDYLPTNLQQQSINKFNNLIDSIDDIYKGILVLNTISSNLNNPKILKEISHKLTQKKFITDFRVFRDVMSVFLIEILQHGIENQEVKDFLEKILIKIQESHTHISKLTPQFEDFLITLHQEGKIDLAKFSFDKKAKISEKFWKEQLPHKKTTLGSSSSIYIAQETYLANYQEVHKDRFETELSEVSSKQLNQSPIQFYLMDLNQESLKRIQDLINKEKLNAGKIISLNILGFERDEDRTEDSEATNNRKKQLLTEVINLFPNLKHLRANQDYFGRQDIDESLDKMKFAFEPVDYGNSEISRAFDATQANQPPQPPRQNRSGGRLQIANQAGKCRASKSPGDNSFDMVDVGKIINRPEGKLFDLMMRNSSNKLELKNALLSDDWLPEDNDRSSQINAPVILSEVDFNQFSPEESEKQTHSFCSFTLDLRANIKSKLLSISPDNEIVGYFTNPQVDGIKFYKDNAGFFYVECQQQCTIKYILKGQELDRKTPQDDLEDLPDSVKQIINIYRGGDEQNFPLSIAESQHSLPIYNFDSNSTTTREKYNQEWLDQLFDISNKGSCRHRVMALANKFCGANLQYNQDFRIIGVNNNHILFEVKTKNDVWITLDLGGSRSQLNYQNSVNYQAPNAIGDEKNPHNKVGSPDPSPSILPQSARPLYTDLPLLNQAQEDPEFQIIEEKILELYQLQSSKDLQEFKQSLTIFIQSIEKKSLLLTTNYFQELKNYLLFFKKTPSVGEIVDIDSNLSFHIIESPQDLAITKDSIKITASSSEITSQTPLAEFFTQAKSQDQKTHLLIIDWQKFDDKHRVATNTMFDNQSKRTIDGVEIPNNVKIICIDEVKSQSVDPAVLSRFNIAIDLRSISKADLLSIEKCEEKGGDTELRVEEIIEFDGEGMDNWQQKLFGRIIVDGEDLKWQKSNFVEDLDGKEGKCSFQFKNFSKKQQDQILELFNQARIQGFINYFGHQIKIPRNFSIKFDQVEFDFKGILKSFSTGKDIALESLISPASSSRNPQQITLKIHKNIQSLEAIDHKENLVIINSQLFDQLLVKKSIEGSAYQENQGLIKEHKNRTLKLFITEQLTPAQFYCLIFNAQKHQVSLELYFAKNIKIDDQDFFRFYQSPITEISEDQASQASQASQVSISSTESRIIVSNDVEKAFNELQQKLTTSADSSTKPINIVNIEDVLFSDLFDDVKHQISESSGKKYFSFQKQESQVAQKLERGEVVVLKGKFPPDLLSSLHEKILDLKTKYPNLYFIIEEDILQLSKESSQLVWLDPSRYKILHHKAESISSKEIIKESSNYQISDEVDVTESPSQNRAFTCTGNKISDQSAQEAQAFITQRKTKLKKLLDANCALQILGHSGVGKSSLFREIKKTGLERAKDVEVFEELENLEKWANDESDKIKILVIDEFNVDGSTNFTMFRDFVNAKTNPADQSARKIFYKGKFYQLSEKHKVVFLGNPHNYGNRYKHKLFSDCQIQEWQLMDFSQSYIYENILKEPIFDKLSQEIKGQLSEEKFKEIAVEAIRKYYENNTKKSDDESDLPQETVRELQERVLQEIVKQIQANIAQEVANNNFISTLVNQETIKQLQIAIKIRQLQRQKHFPPECLGTSGVIFEGDSGVGKSVMIEAVLESQRIQKITSLDLPIDDQQHFYYKIDASLTYQQIKQQLIKAYELGVIVVIDELNTRINEGLEKDINALLTGQHPTDSSIKMKEGFMIITSVNKASSAGRANFSPAIKHRFNNISALTLSKYRDEDFVKIIVNWCEKNLSLNQGNFNLKLVKKIAEKFRKLVAKNPEVNLRALKAKFDEITGEFLQKDQSFRASDQSLDQNLNLKKFKQNDIYFFSPEVDQNQANDNRQNHENFHFRDQNFTSIDHTREKIFDALKTARDNLGISDDDMIQFSILAVKHQGLKNVFNNPRNTQKIEEDFERIFGEKWQEKKSQSIKFSATFQQILQGKKIITGRVLNYREVGMRLKRLDPELLQDFLLKDVQVPLKKEFIKDNFLNKFNKIMDISNSNLQDSIKFFYSTASSRSIT